jgi:integrase
VRALGGDDSARDTNVGNVGTRPPTEAASAGKENEQAESSRADRLLPHLRRWRDRGRRCVVEWGDHSPLRVGRTIRDIAKAAGIGDDVTPHVLRPMAATWLTQTGTDMLVARSFLGMTTRMLETTYAHFRPDHLARAKAAFTVQKASASANGRPTTNVNRA